MNTVSQSATIFLLTFIGEFGQNGRLDTRFPHFSPNFTPNKLTLVHHDFVNEKEKPISREGLIEHVIGAQVDLSGVLSEGSRVVIVLAVVVLRLERECVLVLLGLGRLRGQEGP